MNLVETITVHRFVAIVGASGSGKSSLIRAGVLPILARSGWHTVVVRPAAQPLVELAAGLFPTNTTEREVFLNACAADDQALLRAAAPLARVAAAQRMVLVVDQFEELFTFAENVVTNRAFVANLLAARTSTTLAVVLILRADFYERLGSFDSLPAAFAAKQVYLPPAMISQALRIGAEIPSFRRAAQLFSELTHVALSKSTRNA